MRFLGYTLGDESVPFPPPTPQLMEDMDKLVKEGFEKGILLATGGIAPTSEGTKVILKDGEFSVIDGPFAEAKEIIGGWALIECRDQAEAIEWTKRFLSVAGEGETRIRPVYGPE